MDLTPMLDRTGDTPLYMQLYRDLRDRMEGRMLAAGEKLPSIRQLSAHLGISKQTVENVYQQLLAEGYIESRPRSGLYVLPMEEPPGPRPQAPSGSEPDGKRAEGGDAHPIAYDFKYGDVDTDRFPLNRFRTCMNEALVSSVQALGYGDPLGEPGLREQIANYLSRSRGVACSSQQLLLFAGTQQAIGFLCRHLELAGQPVAMEEPGYDGVRIMLRSHGCRIVPVPLERDGIGLGALRRSSARAVYVTPSHQFPMGMVLPVQKRQQLLQWAYERDGYIIEDDYDSEFRYQGQPIPSLKSLDRGERVVYLGTFSKSVMPAARLSYAVVPPQLAERLRESAGQQSQTVSLLMQRALYLFMQGGHFDRHIRRMRRLYQTKHRKLLEAIERHMEGRVAAMDCQAGLHLMLEVKGRSFEELEKLALERGIRVYSPMKHWLKPDGTADSFVMLGFGGIKEPDIEPGIRLLSEAWFGASPKAAKEGHECYNSSK